MDNSQIGMRALWLTGLVLAMGLGFTCARPKSPCVEQPLEYREEMANVVISGTVKEIMPDANGKKMYKSEIEVKRVFKGDNIVNQFANFEDPVTHHKMLMIDGFGDEEICESDVRRYDTRIFLLNKGTNGDLKLNSSIVRITLTNLEYTDAVVKDIPYKKPEPPQKSPCETHFCAFGAQCMVNMTSGAPYCKCNTRCSSLFAPVCGSDDITYANECLLKKMSCNIQRRIKVKVQGECDPCEGVQCKKPEVCHLDKKRNPVCRCNYQCADSFESVCGTDGRTYSNNCLLRREACKARKEIEVLHSGPCTPGINVISPGIVQDEYNKYGSNPCDKIRCGPEEECSVDRQGRASCVCPPVCQQILRRVCGNDSTTYDSECELRRQSCLQKKYVTLAHTGPCGRDIPCRSYKCEYDAVCVVSHGQPMCQCAFCSEEYVPVCGEDGVTYDNDCKLRQENCEKRTTNRVKHRGPCTGCENVKCEYHSICSSDGKKAQCLCPTSCIETYNPVCGSDGRTYDNECELKVSSCRYRKFISVASKGECDKCRGTTCKFGANCENGHCICPILCPTIHEPICASNGRTYSNECVMRRAACSVKEEWEVEHSGECEVVDPGSGSGEHCHCNPLGSYGTTCNPISRQCTCKPGVGGLRCDRCEPGYWGIHKIADGNAGCIACNCNIYGSKRDDCNQMTGRCVCQSNISGMKCNMCPDRKLLGPQGCKEQPPPRTCAELDCQHGRICKDQGGRLECVCDYSCEESDRHTETVCGTDGQNYASECQLSLFACRLQQDIRVQYYGSCPAAPSTRTTTPMPSTTRSRKTTRHITGPVPPYIDESDQTPGTDQPSTPEVDSCGLMGKIDDLCLEDTDCCVNNSRCRLGLCNCLEGYVPSIDNRQCIEVIRHDPKQPQEPIDNACMHSPCENGGLCELDDSLGYRCVCPLGKTGPLCNKENAFNVPSFSGKSYLKVPRIRKANKNLNIEVVFQTLNKNGILLFNSQSQDGSGDYISLAIKDGFIEFRYDLGGGESTIRSRMPVTLRKSHRVVVKRTGENGILIMDNTEPVAGSSVPTHTSLNLRDPLYVGFVPSATPDVYERIGTSLGLVGCIHVLKAGNEESQREYNLQYPSRTTDIADGADIGECGTNPCKSMPCLNEGTCIKQDQENYQCLCREGYTGLLCETLEDPCASQPCQYGGTCITMGNDIGYECLCTEGRSGIRCEKESLKRVFVPQFSGDAYMELPLEDKVGKQLTIEVWFKAFKANGVILFATQFNGGKGDFISLNLVKRKLQFRFSLGDKPAKIETKSHIHLNKWHRVMVSRQNEKGQMTLDKKPTVKGKAPEPPRAQGTMKELNLGRPLYIGGYKGESSLPVGAEIKSNFSGAIQRVIINGKTIDSLMEAAEEMRNIEEYAGAPCNMNPCMNGGVCIPKLNDADCRCPLEFMGVRCEKRAEHVDKDQPVKFDSNTYLQYPNEKTQKSLAQRNNNIRIRFRTKERNGLLAFQNKGTSVLGDYLSIAVVNGKVEFSYNLGKQKETNLFKIRSSVDVTDNQWHELVAIRELSDGSLQVDEEPTVTASSEPGASQLDTDGDLWIGGNPDLPWGLPPEYYTGFSGCIDEVVINRVDLHLVEDRESHSSTIAFCS